MTPHRLGLLVCLILFGSPLVTAGLPSVDFNRSLYCLDMAKERPSLIDKITYLKKSIAAAPQAPLAKVALEHLVLLLAGSNRYQEALQAYRHLPRITRQDRTFLEYLLKANQNEEVLRQTARLKPMGIRNDMQVAELRAQAFLALGQYRQARKTIEAWRAAYASPESSKGFLLTDIQSMNALHRHLLTLEKAHGPLGKPLYTAGVPKDFRQWSQKKDVPIYFFTLVSADGGLKLVNTRPPFQKLVEDMNRRFSHLSGRSFSLALQQAQTLYVKEGMNTRLSQGGHLVVSRVYAHTLSPLYELAGKAFVIIVDDRPEAGDDASYLGNGLIHVSARRINAVVLMHEILHGLGATHVDWRFLEEQGYRFDPRDRGLMTFTQGKLQDVGIEEKNRWVLGWPRVTPRRLANDEVALWSGEGFAIDSHDFCKPPSAQSLTDPVPRRRSFRRALCRFLPTHHAHAEV